MLRFLTSLTFLYAFCLVVLVAYGYLYYRAFAATGYPRRRFPIVFTLIALACFGFLWVNMHAPLSLRTFSNLDHHSLKHDGFTANKQISLNRFSLIKAGNNLVARSENADEPFYIAGKNDWQLASKRFSIDEPLVIKSGPHGIGIKFSANVFSLVVNDSVAAQVSKTIHKGISAWNLFKGNEQFVNSAFYTNESIIHVLRSVYLLRDQHSAAQEGKLVYFISPGVFSSNTIVTSGNQAVTLKDISFETAIPDQSRIGWGIGFPDRNRDQYIVNFLGGDSFSLYSRYPVSYPLTGEDRSNWSAHTVNKFLLGDPRHMQDLPAAFREGFLFSSPGKDSLAFSPVLLSYQQAAGEKPLLLKGRFLYNTGMEIPLSGDSFHLQAAGSSFAWKFSVRDSFNWKFGDRIISPSSWKWIIFGALGIFFLLVLGSSLLQPGYRLSWVWQILSCVSLVLLSTRIFLYWRYKSFPPYEGMDLPSEQQLESLWNFAVIPASALFLAMVFGWRLIIKLIPVRGISVPNPEARFLTVFKKITVIRELGFKALFFFGWTAVLLASAGLAAFNDFEQSSSRHLAIGLVIAYFFFVFISYRHSPLVKPSGNSWWKLSTGKTLDVLVSNPVKVLLSLSLLAVYVFIDIGFAIVFVNFLLFNEAFLCINYVIAGLSAGSRKNAGVFAFSGFLYLALFILNLLYAPQVLRFLLEMPESIYLAGYLVFAVIIAYNFSRLYSFTGLRRKWIYSIAASLVIFFIAFFFFPREKLVEKAAMTRYRIDVMSRPVGEALESAYRYGNTWEPVIRAAQNQWFINSFIHEENNPGVNQAGFNLLPHAPQNKGARYNAQATDLVTSRFMVAEHGRWAVIFFVLLLLLPVTLLASFYKLYPDFTNRINSSYPVVTTGFSLLNYLLITALLVILAATGKYIFFGQDLPFGSILSKQSILFPSMIITAAVLLFKLVPVEIYPNRKKLIPGLLAVMLLAVVLFLVKPAYNTSKVFRVADVSEQANDYTRQFLQPVLDHFDTSAATKRLSALQKDRLFADSIRKLLSSGYFNDAGNFLISEIKAYAFGSFSRHIDQRNLLYLDLARRTPELAVNENYFRVEAPPHLQQAWAGNIYGDSNIYNISVWNTKTNSNRSLRIEGSPGLEKPDLGNGITIPLFNPRRLIVKDTSGIEYIVTVEPDAFMKNYYVNGSRYYLYPMENRFTWARHFAESVAADYAIRGQKSMNAFVSFDYGLMDSLSTYIQTVIGSDTAYKYGAEYAVTVADGNGRIIALNDYIKGMTRPDPNDKTGFAKLISNENGLVPQSVIRKQVGNLNLLRLHPGPGSTLKPVVFAAIASQLKMDWELFSSEGFSVPQHFYGGEKVAEYDFEKNNGRITSVTDYIKLSDNYYHSNVLLLGSYSHQRLQDILERYFVTRMPGEELHWPSFNYAGRQYWLDDFRNWPGYANGKADFGSDSSFVSIGLSKNFGIHTFSVPKTFDRFHTGYDSLLFLGAPGKSGFILPEYALFDQQGKQVNHRIPYDLFSTCFRGHVKGSSQVMIPPVKMLDAYGKLVTQNRNYTLTLNPYAEEKEFYSFDVNPSISYNQYLSLVRESLFGGMREALKTGTAAALGSLLKKNPDYYYYAKTGTTGDNALTTKSKLLAVVISQKDISDPGHHFRDNKFVIIYFTSQNGPAKQNEKFQAEIIKLIENSMVFKRYMRSHSRETGNFGIGKLKS